MEQLFLGITKSEREKLMDCLQAVSKRFLRGDIILAAGEEPAVGLVLTGAVQVIAEDPMGNRSIIGRMEQGDMFGEAFACAGAKKLPFSVEAALDCEILLIDVRRILVTCPAACPFHHRLIENLMAVLARKNILLGSKIRHISRRTTREKLLSYLSEQARMAQSRSFSIPFNRQELADYLCVDRSAMSAELSRLRVQGVLHFDKNRFTFLRRPGQASPAQSRDQRADNERGAGT